MNGLKFDEDKIKGCIKAYHDQFDKYPYLIVNEETYKELPPQKANFIDGTSFTFATSADSLGCFTTTNNLPKTISVDDKKYVAEEDSGKNLGTWYGARVLIDNCLKYGEVHVG